MKEVTVVYQLFGYGELGESAREVAKQWVLDDPFRSESFQDDCNSELEILFPRSELGVQYSLGYCQGDGLNIYGKLCLDDFLDLLDGRNDIHDGWVEDARSRVSERTIATVRWCIDKNTDVCKNMVELPKNNRYAYCMTDRISFADDWIESGMLCDDEEIPEPFSIPDGMDNGSVADAFHEFEKVLRKCISALAHIMEKEGYRTLVDGDEEEIMEICDTHGWMFLSDGTFFGTAEDEENNVQ